MAKYTDKMLVIDLEATCWDENSPQPKGEESEIIEVGICSMSRQNAEKHWTIIGSESILIKPIKSKISRFCTSLTTLTQAQVDKGVTLFEACRRLEAVYDSPHVPWASWGDYDRKMFEKSCKGVVRYPFGPTHWNMKDFYSLMTKLDREVGMAEALKLEGIPLSGTHHRGVDDAYNVGKILEKILP